MSAIDEWVGELRANLVDPRAHAAEIAELREALQEAADELGEEAACQAFGRPSETADEWNHRPTPVSPNAQPARRLVGSPIGVNPATITTRIADTFDPADPRILVPHVLGVGWSVNLGALAVRLGLITPDQLDEDVMGALTARHFLPATAAACLPALGALALLPFGLGQERLPNEWPLYGPPDGWVTPISGQWMVIAIAIGAIALATLPGRLGASQLWRLLLLIVATMLAISSCGVIAMQVFGGDRPIGSLLFIVMLVASAASLAQGVLLLRAGARTAAHATALTRSPR